MAPGDLVASQAEDGGDYGYGAGLEAWQGGTSYAFGGGTATETDAVDADLPVESEPAIEPEPVDSPAEEPHAATPPTLERGAEAMDLVQGLPEYQPEAAAAERAANGTARVPER